MENSKSRQKKYTVMVLSILALTAICWDISTSLKYAAEEGTYRYEHEFEAVDVVPTTVSIVTSDFEGLQNQVSRSVDPGYDQIEEMVRMAVELQGDLASLISKGDKVMLKPNLVGGNSPSGEGTNTDVRVVKALIKIIDEHCEGDVYIMIGEATARANDDPESSNSVWEISGYRDLLSDPYLAGINLSLINLNQTYEDLVSVNLGNKAVAAPHNGHYMVHKTMAEADVLITVPVLKIHNTGITCALKNQVGIAPGAYYGYNKMRGSQYYGGLVHDAGHRRWTEEVIVDLSLAADFDFTVVDAIMCLESGKDYTGNNQVRFNTILAGKDLVAVDHVATRLFCLNPDDIPHITLAEKVGLGTNDPEYIGIVGSGIDETKIQVKKNSSQHGRFGQSNRTWLLSQPFYNTNMAMEHIENEASFIPTAGKDGWSQPVYFFDERIDLLSYYQGSSNIITYAFTCFDAPHDQQAELWIGSDEDLIIYLNGEQVYSRSGVFSYGDNVITNDKKVIDVRKGENILMVKSLQKFGDYSFALNICEIEPNVNYAGNRVEGLKFYTDAKGGTTRLNSSFSDESLRLNVAPNPVVFPVKVDFSIPVAAHTTIDVYDLHGVHIVNLMNDLQPPGSYTVFWNKNQSNATIRQGIYLCILRSGNYNRQIKLFVKE